MLEKANEEYSEKQNAEKSEKCLFKLAWDIKELEHLNSSGRQMRVNISVLVDKLRLPGSHGENENIALKVTKLRDEMVKFVKNLSRHQRTAATHLLVVMISPEERKKKPYAFPVQCIPYKGLKDSQVRSIINDVVKEMCDRGMKVAGWFR